MILLTCKIAIGVSNFNVQKLKELLKECRIPPAVNQIELHPYLPQNELVRFCKDNKIVVTAYSPLGSLPKNGLLEDPTVAEIAKKHGKTPAQVLLAWGIKRDTIIIPKSANLNRVKENLECLSVVLTDEDLTRLNSLYKTHGVRYINPSNF